MQRMTTLVVSVLALSALLGGTAVAAENQPPLADAGLDQSVEREMSVQLDANGSRDPDGTIESVEWSIETPDGATRTPDCQTCVQTTFSPAETGQYNVTVTVTDNDSVSRSDTLHVDVVAAGGPSVSMSAPPAVPV
ncbi:PKD domain-containing protein, partial [Haloarcula hispanica]|uniref:PKD domain-containing protein n=1 Tax=Haloarcula hispanica TaxID=51589 RepID=UPI001F5C40F7